MLNKNELRTEFGKDWQIHYELPILKEKGFFRQQCKKCGRNFWAIGENKRCANPSCIGYEFIGNPPSNKKLNYVETWEIVKKYFTSHNHGYVAPYPTVARWREDLYFTIASINDFQPYVVNGELEPPSNPLIIPQPCIRFSDIANVGVTGRHYTNFVMIGQHAFNTEKTGLFYWKNEALEHDIEYLKQLGINEEELVFIEDVWVGGGNFGPCMEYFSRGLELGNCVFMQYETTKTGNRELKTKVIDMGAGLSRLAWITHGSPTSYEIVFGNVVEEMKREFDVHVNEELFTKYAKIAGSLTIDEVSDIEAERTKIAKMLGYTKEELFDKLEPLYALYATADHTCTVLFTITDGMLPSNSGGGYNLRLILRRVFGFEEINGWKFDFEKIISSHARHLHGIFPHLKDGVESTVAIINEEKKKFLTTKEKSKGKIVNLIKSGKNICFEDLKTLYISNGIPPESVAEAGMENGMKIEVPYNFYEMIRTSDETKEKPEPIEITAISLLPKTEILFYSSISEFEANVVGIIENKYVALNRTAFYAESGGQVADSGTIDGKKVKNVIKASNVILHEVENIISFKIGQKIIGKVDMKRRKAISKNHTAAHLLNAAARTILGLHVWQNGSYKDANKAHLDITHYKRITREELNLIEEKVNELIMENLPIVIEEVPRNVAEEKYGFCLYQGGAVPGKELRLVKIERIIDNNKTNNELIDVEACGGTHHMNKTTGEIGFFRIIKHEGIQDGVERISYATGLNALAYVQKQENILRDSCSNIGVSEAELTKTVKRFFEEWKARGKKIKDLSSMIADGEAKELILESKKNANYIFKIIDVDLEILKLIAEKIIASENTAIAIANKEGNLVCACGTKSKFKANEILNEIVKKYGGKGGGTAQLAAGIIKGK